MNRIASLLLLVLAVSAMLYGQATEGCVPGAVADASGAVVTSARTGTTLNGSHNLRYDWGIPGYDIPLKRTTPNDGAGTDRAHLAGDPNPPAFTALSKYVRGNQGTRLSTFGANLQPALRLES